MKRVAIIQSNYIPWKGYFDLIASVDEFIIYDHVQYTKGDWRNRNKVKTATGAQWLSVPVSGSISERIEDVIIPDTRWQIKHWKTLETNYRKSRFFTETEKWLKPLYTEIQHNNLSQMNLIFLKTICKQLQIYTKFSSSSQYNLIGDRTESLLNLCKQAGADIYVSGPSAKSYLDEDKFNKSGIKIEWINYDGYPSYPQLYDDFVHQVSVLDLLFNCGANSSSFMKFANSP